MGIGDIRLTVLQTAQEVFRKLGLDAPSSLSQNKGVILTVDFINDICDEISDFGNWQETILSANVTAVANQHDYSISTSANIKNIADIFFTARTGPLRHTTIEQMRLMTRVTATGVPSQYTIFGTDNNGNPNIRVRPTPTSAEAGKLFSVLAYTKAPKYTTGDGALVIPFPGNVVVAGVLAKYTLNESGGTPTDKYQRFQQDYLDSRKEALNRFNGDSGWNVSFRPSIFTGRRR